MKTNWKDVDMRKVNPRWKCFRCARELERLTGAPDGLIVFFRPDGTRARREDDIRALQALDQAGRRRKKAPGRKRRLDRKGQ